MSDPILERIQREAGIPELIDVLVERLAPTDLQSLLLEVYRRRATGVKPSQLLERYERDRFVRPSDLAPRVLADFESLVWSLLPEHYTAIELSPVCPLGTNAIVATVDQNKVVTTIRNTEVVADATSVLALECATRRRLLLRSNPQNRERVRLCTSHRVLRGQAYQATPGVLPHFRLLGLCTAGRDEGSFQFETTSLVEQIAFYLQLLREVSRIGYQTHQLRVTLTDLEQGRREQTLIEQVLRHLMANHSGVLCELDPARQSGRGYYVGACFHIYATNVAGTEFELIDGGFTTWTQQLLRNSKERLLISGLGTERLCSQFSVPLYLMKGRTMAEIISTSNALFLGKDEQVQSTYHRLLEALHALGPFQEEPKKTSIHLVRTVGFAGVHPRKSYLILNLRTDSALESPRITKSEHVSKNRFHNEVKLTSPDDIDEELLGWLKEAYALG